jgi:HD-GYP domain-containing protein (c-di-GMP phosphodiesterase class II)
MDIKALQEENLTLLDELEAAYSQLEHLLIGLQVEKDVIYAELREKIERYRSLFVGTLQVLVNAIDAKDPYTRGHSSRVSVYCRMIGTELGLGLEQREYLQYAGLFHDVGKIGIEERILRKPQPLDMIEWTIMQGHPVIGATIIQPIDLFKETVLPMVLHHHEKFDGKGYPDGLEGEEIPLGARIVAIADAVDTMATDRPYRMALPSDAIVGELRRCTNSHFDPKIAGMTAEAIECGTIELLVPRKERKVLECV